TVPVTYDGIKDPEQVKVPVTVLPKPEADEILVPKNGDKEKAKEKVLAKAKKAIEDSTFTGKLPQGATVTVDETATVTVPDLTEDTEVEVTVKYTVPGQDKPLTTTVKVPVTVVESVPQIVPVDESNKQPDPEKSIDKTDYPEGSTFRYKTPEGQTTPYDGTTPGDKPVTVVVKDKDGKVLVEVPATIKVVETKPTPIETPVTNTPLTEGDYTKGMKIPEGATVKVGDLPDLTTPGEKAPVKVTITLPNGKSYTVDVPVTVTPVKEIETPVSTTPLTPEDYTKGIKIPEGGKVTNVANIPDLTTPGKKDPVKVTIELPNGKVITVEVPVTVTPKSQNGGGVISQNGDSTVQIVTEYLDENGNRITSDKEGKHNQIALEGYEYSHSTTDAKGNTLHHYKKVTNPINQEQPSAPDTPTSPEKPVATPVQTSSTDSKQVAETTVSNDKKELPNTGTEDKAGLASLGLLGMLGAFGLVARKKKED
ncbi:Rib/alpha-like domain-containing protein, partial [uncultured Streptococcus sp.]|uniref:Rib/alpha-like domain-containing protein n=1 Tax=uncultured Streptococcus sp. TaxID=83427 RepID=UPI0025E94E1D